MCSNDPWRCCLEGCLLIVGTWGNSSFLFIFTREGSCQTPRVGLFGEVFVYPKLGLVLSSRVTIRSRGSKRQCPECVFLWLKPLWRTSPCGKNKLVYEVCNLASVRPKTIMVMRLSANSICFGYLRLVLYLYHTCYFDNDRHHHQAWPESWRSWMGMTTTTKVPDAWFELS